MNTRFSLAEIVFIFTVTIGLLMAAIAQSYPLFLAILPGLFALGFFSFRKGITLKEIIRSSFTGMKRNKDVAWLLTFIGLILPTWFLAGTIDDLNALFLLFITPEYYLTIAFLVTALMSFVVGSAVGSLSIVGIPLIGVGELLGIPLGLVGGALVSGAFVGDRSSPLSSSFQLLAFSVELSVKEHLRTISPTMGITFFLTTLLFLIIDLTMSVSQTSAGTAGSAIVWGDLLVSLLPPLLLLLMILLGKNMKTCFSLSIVAAGGVLLSRGVSLDAWLEGAMLGVGSVNGLVGMIPFILFILIVGVYCQIIEDTKMLQPFLERLFSNKKSLPKNTAQTIGVAAGVSLISPNQSFPILLTGRALLPHWTAHFHRRDLSRTLADSTVVFAGLVPWSLLAILCSTILGMPVIVYLPFAIFLWLSPVVTFVYSYWKPQSQNKNEPSFSKQQSRSHSS